MDLLAYFKFYRKICKGEWVYIYDHRIELYHWVNPSWLKCNRWDEEYTVIESENY